MYNSQTTQFLFYSGDDGKTSIQVVLDSSQETIWTTQKGMSDIFNVQVPAISKHLKNIFQDGELNYDTTVSKMETVVNRGFRGEVNQTIEYYNLDAIIAVGYRVNSVQATRFRIWATSILREYLTKGFALDDQRLKQGNRLFGRDYFQELLERIREIRASERLFWDKITDLYKDCSVDYDPKSVTTINFYQGVQNKFHYAIHQHTASEIIKFRADYRKPHMGLTSWKNEKTGGKILKTDVIIAKNYLSEIEINELNRLVTMFLDYAENLAQKRVVSTMTDWTKRLDAFLVFNEYPVLEKYGKVRHEVAKQIAETEYSKFRLIQDREYRSDFNNFVEATKIGQMPIESLGVSQKSATDKKNTDTK